MGCRVGRLFGDFWQRICFRERILLGGTIRRKGFFACCFREERRGIFSFRLRKFSDQEEE